MSSIQYSIWRIFIRNWEFRLSVAIKVAIHRSNKEYQETFGEEPLLKLVASITGMERSATEKEFSKFLNDESLNSDQIDFVDRKSVV